jgi:O-antigen/teichoic acid export membrane protein
MVMLGKERINLYNLVTIIQLAFMLFSLALFFLLFDKHDIEAYIISLYIQFATGAIIGYLIIRKDFYNSQTLESRGVMKEIFKYGSLTQTANIIQFLNYRLGYYIIDTFSGKAVLGVFNVGVQLAEGLWLIGKSLALIQYARLSNNKDLEYAKVFSIRLLKISVLSTLFAILIMFVIPAPVFTFIFGSEFFHVKKVFIYLSPGILSIAACHIISHYFSGLGKVHINTIGSSIGLLFTLGAGFLLIPALGLTGAALTASASYFFMMVFQFIMFMIHSKARFSELLVNKTDIALIVDKTRAILASLKKIR